jgi:vacuolar iron transporter family protein
MAVAIASKVTEDVERSVGTDAEQVNEHGIGRRLREIILGGQDGLVNVLGLVLGIAAATAQTRVIMVAGLAATFSESIAMAGVAYTSALADRDYKLSRLPRENAKFEEAEGTGLVGGAAITGISTLVGSLIPLIPFFFLPIGPATVVALPLCAAVLFGVGACKALTTVGDWRISGAQMLLIGMVSAFAGYVIGRLLHVSGA